MLFTISLFVCIFIFKCFVITTANKDIIIGANVVIPIETGNLEDFVCEICVFSDRNKTSDDINPLYVSVYKVSKISVWAIYNLGYTFNLEAQEIIDHDIQVTPMVT